MAARSAMPRLREIDAPVAHSKILMFDVSGPRFPLMNGGFVPPSDVVASSHAQTEFRRVPDRIVIEEIARLATERIRDLRGTSSHRHLGVLWRRRTKENLVIVATRD